MTKKLAAIILAAGKGKRMKSDLPKVLHQLDGRPMICHLLDTITSLEPYKIVVVVGFKGELVAEEIKNYKTEIVWQKELLGTGHAVMMAEDNFADYKGDILVAAGDAPFLSHDSIKKLFQIHTQNGASATCLSTSMKDPTGYGRIIRQGDSDILTDIIEEKDADKKIKNIREINSGTFCFNSSDLFPSLKKLDNKNVQKEYYLTDSIKILRQAGKKCLVWEVADPFEVQGINSIEQLEALENMYQKRKKMVNNSSK